MRVEYPVNTAHRLRGSILIFGLELESAFLPGKDSVEQACTLTENRFSTARHAFRVLTDSGEASGPCPKLFGER